jgi:hypothetical protein
MKKTIAKKLTLSRETIAALGEDHAKAAQGGLEAAAREFAAPLTGNSKDVCCC